MLCEHGIKIAPSGYYAFKSRPACARSLSDAWLSTQIERVFWDRNLGRGISGARKVWHLLRGVRRGRKVTTTRPSSSDTRAPDHVQRCFRAQRPNQLWVVDFT